MSIPGITAVTNVSIHAPYIGSDHQADDKFAAGIVSIHAPYIGSDVESGEEPCNTLVFQSTLPT